MASSPENLSMAVFCDFENVALGVRDANYEKFDIKPILERLLLKGSIVVKKAYCDWDRYKSFKSTMHEANFELIEIPHVRQSGKNSADIRLVVDALDLCYTKSHVNTFVIISGDSDFSPLVSKLRENAKQVIGVGVKQSTSDLLVANCDEFIFYDDLVRESRRTAAKRDAREAPAAKRTPDEENRRKEKYESRKTQAIDMAVETFDALVSERGDSGKIWASMLKEAIKRRKPDFSESYYGFRTFGNLLEEAQARGLLEFGRDEKSGAYVYRSSAAAVTVEVANEQVVALSDSADGMDADEANEANGNKREARDGREAPEANGNVLASNGNNNGGGKRESRRNGRGGRKQNDFSREERNHRNGNGNVAEAAAPVLIEEAADLPAPDVAAVAVAVVETDKGQQRNANSRRNGRGARKPAESATGSGRERQGNQRGNRGNAPVEAVEVAEAAAAPPVIETVAPVIVELAPEAVKPAAKARAARKPAAKKAKPAVEKAPAAVLETPVVVIEAVAAVEEKAAKPARKPAARSRTPRKKATPSDAV